MMEKNNMVIEGLDSFMAHACAYPEEQILYMDAVSKSDRKQSKPEIIGVDNGIVEIEPHIGNRINSKLKSTNGEPLIMKEIRDSLEPTTNTRLTINKLLVRKENTGDVYNHELSDSIPQDDLDNIHATETFDIEFQKHPLIYPGEDHPANFYLNLLKIIDYHRERLSDNLFQTIKDYLVHQRSILMDKSIIPDRHGFILSSEGRQFLPIYLYGLSPSLDVGKPLMPWESGTNGYQDEIGCLYQLKSVGGCLVCR